MLLQNKQYLRILLYFYLYLSSLNFFAFASFDPFFLNSAQRDKDKERQLYEKIENMVGAIDKVHITKVYFCRPDCPSGGSTVYTIRR
jgi:hypothetical protein